MSLFTQLPNILFELFRFGCFFLVLNSSLLFIVSFLILNSFVFSLLTIELFFICLFVHQQLYMVANESANIYAWAMQCKYGNIVISSHHTNTQYLSNVWAFFSSSSSNIYWMKRNVQYLYCLSIKSEVFFCIQKNEDKKMQSTKV